MRRLVRNRRYRAGQAVQLLWNGRDDAGAIVPDGSYRVRVGLRRQGRSVTLVDEIRIDATPPHTRGEGGEAGGDRRPADLSPARERARALHREQRPR